MRRMARPGLVVMVAAATLALGACSAAVTSPAPTSVGSDGGTQEPLDDAGAAIVTVADTGRDGSPAHDASSKNDAAPDASTDAAADAGPQDPSPLRVVVAPSASSDTLIGSIWGSDANNVYFCGSDEVYNGGLWRWNGTSVALVAAPSGRCKHVYGAGPSNVWVRWDHLPGEFDGLHRRFDGTQWTTAPQVFNGVAPVNANDAVGFAGVYNGSRTIGQMTFGEQISGTTVGSTNNLPKACPSSRFPAPAAVVQVYGENDIWAKLGDRCVMHWDGAAWTSQPPATLGYTYAINGPSTNDLWAVGDGTCPIAHWNGATWGPACVGLPAAETSVRSVYGAPDGKAWAVSSKGIYAFDGTTWSSVPKPLSIGATILGSVWGTSSTDVWFGGEKETILRTR